MKEDSQHFSVEMGLHQEFMFILFKFVLMMDKLTQHIQGKVWWCMLFVDNTILIEETHGGVDDRLMVFLCFEYNKKI